MMLLLLFIASPYTAGSIALDSTGIVSSESLAAAAATGARVETDVMVPDMLVALPGIARVSLAMPGEWRPAHGQTAPSAQRPLRL